MRLLDLECFELEWNRSIERDRRQLLAESYKLAAFLECFAVTGAFHFAGPPYGFLGAAELLN